MLVLPRRFLQIEAIRDGVTASAYRRPLGYQQILAATLAASTPLTVPLVANTAQRAGYAVIQCEVAGAAVRWRDDGTDPTNAIGMNLLTGQELDYSGDLTMIRFIVSAGAPILNVSFYA